MSCTINADTATYKLLKLSRLLELWEPHANSHCMMVQASIGRAKHSCITQGAEDYLLAVCHRGMTLQ